MSMALALDTSSRPAEQGIDWTQLPQECRLLVLQHLDTAARAACRTSCKLTRKDVTVAARTLTWCGEDAAHLHSVPLPIGPALGPITALVSGLNSLQHLNCSGMTSLASIEGIPPTLRSLDLSGCSSLTSMQPLQRCTALEQLTLTIGSDTMALALPPVMSAVSESLRHLHLTSTCAVSEAAAQTVAGSLQPLSLQGLSLDLWTQKIASWDALADKVAQMSDLQALDLSCKRLRDGALLALAPAVRQLQRLRSLVLDGLPTGSASAGALSEALACLLATLTQLRLHGVGTRLADAPALARALHGHAATLTTVALSCMHLGPADVAALAPALQRCSGLTSLDLSSCNFNADMAGHLAAALSDSARSLRSFGLCNNPLGGRGTAALAPALAAMTCLVRLDYIDNYLGPAGAAVLAEALAPLAPSLTHLDVSGNYLEDGGTQRLAPVIGRLAALQHLGYAHNDLGPAGAPHLAAALTAIAPSLTALDLSRNPLKVECTAALAPALSSLTSLQHLICRDTGLGPDGVAVLAPALPAMRSLWQLDLQDTRLGFAGLRMVGRALQVMSERQHWVIHCDHRLLERSTLRALSQEGSHVLASVFEGLGIGPSWEVCAAPLRFPGYDGEEGGAAAAGVLGLQVTLRR